MPRASPLAAHFRVLVSPCQRRWRLRRDDVGALHRLQDALSGDAGNELIGLARDLPALVAERVGDREQDVLVGPVNPGCRLTPSRTAFRLARDFNVFAKLSKL